jgi:hypothetical protein
VPLRSGVDDSKWNETSVWDELLLATVDVWLLIAAIVDSDVFDIDGVFETKLAVVLTVVDSFPTEGISDPAIVDVKTKLPLIVVPLSISVTFDPKGVSDAPIVEGMLEFSPMVVVRFSNANDSVVKLPIVVDSFEKDGVSDTKLWVVLTPLPTTVDPFDAIVVSDTFDIDGVLDAKLSVVAI